MMMKISLNKSRILNRIIIVCIFLIFGFLLAIYPQIFKSNLFRNELFIRVVGILCLFFIIFIPTLLRKFADNKPGLIIGYDGILDNSTMFNLGLIKWEDISKIEVVEKYGVKMLQISIFKNKEYYINNTENLIIKYCLKLKMNNSDVLTSMSANILSCSFGELESAIRNGFERYKKEQKETRVV
ncbi:hypothetical protein GO491_12080 [Flavobacteriaceae bacterium Ap0902]|nr:hypothetical protein [Flavobacteriaceae bacterium Ap0902]